MNKSVINEIAEILKKYGEIYPESMQLLETLERLNIIKAYYAGAIDQNTGNLNVDKYLNQHYATTTLPTGDSNCNS